MQHVYAQVDIGSQFPALTQFKSFGLLVNVILRNAIAVVGIIAFVFIILGAVGIIAGAGSGDAKQMEKGKDMLLGAVLGLVVVVGAVWIMQIIEYITGIKILNPGI